jgi:hypothetical protein
MNFKKVNMAYKRQFNFKLLISSSTDYLILTEILRIIIVACGRDDSIANDTQHCNSPYDIIYPKTPLSSSTEAAAFQTRCRSESMHSEASNSSDTEFLLSPAGLLSRSESMSPSSSLAIAVGLAKSKISNSPTIHEQPAISLGDKSRSLDYIAKPEKILSRLDTSVERPLEKRTREEVQNYDDASTSREATSSSEALSSSIHEPKKTRLLSVIDAKYENNDHARGSSRQDDSAHTRGRGSNQRVEDKDSSNRVVSTIQPNKVLGRSLDVTESGSARQSLVAVTRDALKAYVESTSNAADIPANKKQFTKTRLFQGALAAITSDKKT